MELRVAGISLSNRNAGSVTGIIRNFAIIPLLTVALIASCHHKKEDSLLWLLFLGNRGGGTGAPGIVADPAFTPQPGTFSNDQSVDLSTTTPGATIHYTTDGSAPTAASAAYSAPIAVTGDGTSVTIQAIAVKSGMVESSAVSAGYTINYGQVSTPQFSPVAGTFTSDQSVTITSTTSGATIYYTTDGTTPTTASTVYSTPIPVSGHGTTKTIKAIAVKTGMADSTVAGAVYSIAYSPAAAPAFSPAPGTYNTDQAVTITTTTAGASIHYTTDGTAPTAASAAYSAPIPVAGNGTNTTIKAIAVKAGMLDSAIASAGYTINWNTVAMPTLSPAPYAYATTQNVTLTTTTAGASIYYTTNGTVPTTASALYTGPIPVAATATIQAIAVKAGMLNSSVASGTYTITSLRVSAPTFTPIAGAYPTTQTVTIATVTAGATIYYTTDGTTPTTTTTSGVYLAPFALTGDMTVKAVAIKAGLLDSVVGSTEYRVLRVSQIMMSPLPGNYAAAQAVILSTATAGAAIYYTTDGSAPTTASPLYSSPISVSAATTIRAIAVKSGYVDSPVGSGVYTIGGTAKYSIGGWVSGLQGGTLVIQNNGGDDLTLTGNGPFVFSTPLATGAAFSVTVASQPSPQTCRVDTDDSGANTGGTVGTAHVKNVSIVCGPVSLRVADTGQTGCWDAAGIVLACAGTGQDGAYANTPFARSFTGPTAHATYTTNYTTKDNVTGLVWKTCSEGQTGANCQGTGVSPAWGATVMTWINAGVACYNLNGLNGGAGYAGRRDWRLPTKKELESLPNYGVFSPAIDAVSFPGTVSSAYWTSTTYAPGVGNAWYVFFVLGDTSFYIKTFNFYVHCVSSG